MTIRLNVNVGIVTVAPVVAISLTGTPYTAGQTIADITFNLTGETSGTPALMGHTVTIEIDGTPRSGSYVLSAGESIVARVTASHVTGAINEVSAASSVNSAGGATLAVSLVRRSNMEIAPETLVFQATPAGFDTPGPSGGQKYNPQDHEIRYTWNFNDPGTWTRPVNVEAYQLNSNVGHGRRAPHCFNAPGTYSVVCSAYEPSSGKTAVSAPFPISIKDPDVEFSGADTFFVDTGGNYSGRPAGSVGYPSIDAAFTATRNATPKRIMLRRGQVHTKSAEDMRSVIPSIYWEASNPGDGTLPVIKRDPNDSVNIHTFFTNNMDPGGLKDWVFRDIRFEGGWNSVTETTTDAKTNTEMFRVGTGDPVNNNLSYMNWHNCEFYGLAKPYSGIIGARVTDGRFWNNCDITSWLDYASFHTQEGYSAYLGCRIAQDGASLCGANPKTFTHNQHGCIRVQYAQNMWLEGTDFSARCGWFRNFGTFVTAQPVYRWNQMSGTQDHPHNFGDDPYFSVHRCSLEGGFGVLAMATQNTTQTTLPANILIEGNTFVGNWMSPRLIASQFGGMTIRSNLMIHVDADRSLTNIYDPVDFIWLGSNGTNAENAAAPVKVYSNTCVNQTTAAHYFSNTQAVLLNASGFSNIAEDNNILHQPALAAPQTAFAPLSSNVMWAPRYKEYETSVTSKVAGSASDPASIIDAVPQAGSPALGAATTGNIAATKRDGSPKDSPANLGCD